MNFNRCTFIFTGQLKCNDSGYIHLKKKSSILLFSLSKLTQLFSSWKRLAYLRNFKRCNV